MNFDALLVMKSEITLLVIIFLILALKIGDSIRSHTSLLNLVNLLLCLNFILGFIGNKEGGLFNGMFHTSNTLFLEKSILNLGTLIISLQAFDWLKDHKHISEFYILLLCTLLGMDFMISSGNFLMFYLGLELSSIPLAALCNYDLHQVKSSESAVKMILSSAFASCFLLFGISMLYGTTGTLDFKEMAPLLGSSKLQMLAFIFTFAGFAFKLSTVPFHLWTADVYEGAPVPVTAYLSVISKGSVIFIFITTLFQVFHNYDATWYRMLWLSIMLSVTVGNLFALRQHNIKRFLAFSSISQMGYILLGISSGTSSGTASAIFFLIIYTLSNLGAFGVVTLVSARTGHEDISDYRGFYTNNKYASWVLAICLFSLAGIPPTAGFFGKMFLVTSGAAKGNMWLIGIAVANMVVSLYYYLRIVKAMFIDPNPHPLPALKGSGSLKIALAVCFAGTILMGFAGGILDYLNSITGN